MKHVVLVDSTVSGLLAFEAAKRLGCYVTFIHQRDMSIRAREFAIPAAIGVGDVKFRSLLSSKRLILDCAERRIQVLS